MRLVSFRGPQGASFGIVVGDRIIDAGSRLAGEFTSLRHVLEAGAVNLLRGMEGIAPDLTLADVELAPPIHDPAARFLCIGINYMPHIREMGREPPEYPVVFVRFAQSLVGHGQPLVRPLASETFDFEGELAVIIGTRARHVARDEAMSVVAGYSCFNDGSVREFQRHGAQWTPGKNFPQSGSFGPWLVTADEVPDPAALRLRTRLNGETVQDESVSALCFDIPALIVYISTWLELLPGDVIVSGTPGGVGAGRNPPLWMSPGDTVEVEIGGIGVLRNGIVDEAGR